MIDQITMTSTWTIVRREIVRVVRLWRQTIFPSVITTVLYFSIFGVVLGERVGKIDGVPYIEFVSPGLMMLALVTNSYTNSAFSVYIEKFHRSFEELLSSPLSDHQIIIGFAVGSVFRGVVCAVVVWLCAVYFLGYQMAYPLSMLGACVLSAWVFALLGMLNGLVARSFDDLNVMTTFLLNPLIMLGGVFYSVTMLKGIWQTMSLANPILYVGNLFRYCMLGVSNITPLFIVVVLLSLSVFLYVLTLWLMSKTTYVRQ